MVVVIYDSVADKFALIDKVMETMPPLITAMAGDAQTLSTPSGWLHMKFFTSVPVIFGPFAVMAGAGLVAVTDHRVLLAVTGAAALGCAAVPARGRGVRSGEAEEVPRR